MNFWYSAQILTNFYRVEKLLKNQIKTRGLNSKLEVVEQMHFIKVDDQIFEELKHSGWPNAWIFFIIIRCNSTIMCL